MHSCYQLSFCCHCSLASFASSSPAARLTKVLLGVGPLEETVTVHVVVLTGKTNEKQFHVSVIVLTLFTCAARVTIPVAVDAPSMSRCRCHRCSTRTGLRRCDDHPDNRVVRSSTYTSELVCIGSTACDNSSVVCWSPHHPGAGVRVTVTIHEGAATVLLVRGHADVAERVEKRTEACQPSL